jgi:preprotein translocase subunit SecG
VSQSGSASSAEQVGAHRFPAFSKTTEDDMKLFLQILLIASSVLLIVAVLLHRGRGGGLSSLFGGGMQSSLSGSSVAEKNLDRITLLLGAVWLISIIGLGLLLKV